MRSSPSMSNKTPVPSIRQRLRRMGSTPSPTWDGLFFSLSPKRRHVLPRVRVRVRKGLGCNAMRNAVRYGR
ncbi:hypothetical protein ACLOJK_035045, partial [Asimina triloba]